MPGRHSTTKRPSRAGPILAAVLAVAVIVALGIYLAPRLTEQGNASDCDQTKEVAIAAPPDLRPAMIAAVNSMQKHNSVGCVRLTVNTVYPDSSVSQINSNANSMPTVWILDTRSRLAELEPKARQHVKVVGGAANTPLVIVAAQQASHTSPPSWRTAFEEPDFVLPSPSSSVASILAIGALGAEGSGDPAPVLTDTAARQADESLPSFDVMVRAAHRQLAPVRWFPATEQQAVSIQMRHAGWQINALVPKSGTVFLDYPIAVRTDGEPATTTVADQLKSFLADTDGRSVLGEYGYRAPDGSIMNGASLNKSIKRLHLASTLPELMSSWMQAQSAAR